MSTGETVEQPNKHARKRLALLGCGYLFFGLGSIGIALPIFPTTIFWIIAAVCFARSSPKMYERVVNWPQIGPVIDDLLSNGVIRRRNKAIAVTGMAGAAAIVVLTPLSITPTLAGITGITLGAGYVLSRPSRPASETSS